MTSSKLQSLQGLRGIAICLVIVFHLFPDKFVNGFVGVDMFFVLSGYLMTRILSRRITTQSIIDFYKKRFNRIVPLFYLTIFITILFVLTLVLRSERADFIYDVTWSLPLISNIQPIFEHHSYWEQVSSIRYLTHLWSLCTELQYYLMAPIIHIIASKLQFPIRIASYSIAIVIMSTFQILTPFELSYCFLASRVWQFLMGSVAFELWKHFEGTLEEHVGWRKKEKKVTVVDIFPASFLVVLMAMLFFPMVFEENSTRITVTVASAAFCFLCGHLEDTLFTWNPIVYIGNLSYVIYLIHWPVINFIRYIQQRDNTGLSVDEALIAVALIMVLSLLAHYFVENKILTLDFSVNLTMSFFLFGLSYALIPWLQTKECFAMQSLSPEQADNAEFNLMLVNTVTNISQLPCDSFQYKNWTYEKTYVEYCSHKGNGTGTVLVIGNSVGIRAFPTIFKVLDGRYEEIRLFARHGSAPLLEISKEYNDEALKMTQELKPQVLWIVQSMNELILHGKTSPYDFSAQHLDQVVPETMNKFKGFADMVFVDLPYFVTGVYPAKLIARSLIYRKDLNAIGADLQQVGQQINEQTDRLRRMNCTNCEFIDIQKALVDGRDKFYFFARNSTKSLNYDGSHLTKTAYEMYVKNVYQEKIEEFLAVMERRMIR